VRAGVVARIAIASVLLAIVVGGGFAVLLHELRVLRASGQAVSQSWKEHSAADELETLVIDLQTGLRGFLITGQPHFLQPWVAARSAIPEQSKRLTALVSDPALARQVRKLTGDINSYIDDTVPLVAAAQRNRPAGLSAGIAAEGKRVDALQAEFDSLANSDIARATARQQRDDQNAELAVTLAAVALGVSVLLILLFGVYMMRAIAVPLRGAAAMADRLAGGDLAVRLRETGIGEVGTLQRAFNHMGNSLGASRDELKRLADEQAALRRVATLVARAAPPADVFAAVAQELGQLFAAESALFRYEPGPTATPVGSWSLTGDAIATGTPIPLAGHNVLMLILRTGRPARIDGCAADDSSPMTTLVGGQGGESAVGAPIRVADRLWGAAILTVPREDVLPSDTEAHLADFAELVATAIANTQAQAELTASRARIVASADETRRRIERDLHDGVQQRLVSLVLELRAVRVAVPPGQEQLAAEMDSVATGLNGALDELRELSRGIHPPILTQSGLGPALKALARRSAVPVELNVGTAGRLPKPVEIGAYYIISEALTNAAKHADATIVTVDSEANDEVLRVHVRDDGVGGADFAGGSGLIGLRDRVQALGGRITLQSDPGNGTSLSVELPLAAAVAAR
jgi:signal transduction histidine kinase